MTIGRSVIGPVARGVAAASGVGFDNGTQDPALTLWYDFAGQRRLSAREGYGPKLGITRATTATYVGGDGLIATAASGEARFSYNPTTGVSLGLLVEEARTNLCLQSEDFDTTWANTDTDSPTTNNVAPDGTATADEIAATSTADIPFAVYQAFTGRTATQVTTASCFLKVGTNATLAQLAYDSDGSGADGFFCNFNLTTGAKGTATALAAGTVVSSTIESFGSGWYRCSITGTIAVGTVARFTISIVDAIGNTVFQAADLTDNDSIIAWGGDVEIGAFPTSYIPTVAASVTRNADVVSTATIGWFNAAAGSFYAKFNQPITSGTAEFPSLFTMSDTTLAERSMAFLRESDRVAFWQIRDGNVQQAQINPANSYTLGSDSEFAVSYAANDVAAYLDGTAATPDTAASLPTVTTFGVGQSEGGTTLLNGHIKEIRYYNERKPNLFLQQLSSGLNP